MLGFLYINNFIMCVKIQLHIKHNFKLQIYNLQDTIYIKQENTGKKIRIDILTFNEERMI